MRPCVNGGRREGFTLVELIVAMLLLSVVALTLGSATGRLSATSARGTQAMAALDLVDDRLRAIQADPSYGTIEARYGGSETALAGYPGLVRTTALTHVQRPMPGSRMIDYKIAVVTVTGPGLPDGVVRSVAVGAP